MADLGEAYVNIIPKAPGIQKELKSLLGDGAAGAGEPAGKAAGSSFMAGFKKLVAGAAVGKVLKDAFSAGGDLQQSFGGLETIYGHAADQAKAFAASSALAGISANDFAEQAVSFGASLKQAFDGGEAEAIKAANTAIMDMADNSAKMGTSIESIQQAYQGFAKQNYTMLDNLKLGYGGTKTEMERLLAGAQKLTGVKYDISNLADVYDAIHVIQGNLGITGVAAEEAKTTLTGSLGAMKASWLNTIASLTSGEGDFSMAMSNLSTAVGYFATNVLSMVGNVVGQLPDFFAGIGAVIVSNAPQLMQSVQTIVTQMAQGFVSGFPQFITSVSALATTVAQAISTAAPEFLAGGLALIEQLVDSMFMAAPILLTAAANVVQTLASSLIANAPALLNGGIALIQQISQGLSNAIPEVIGIAANLLGQLLSAILSAAPSLITGGVELISQLVVGLADSIPLVVAQVPVIFEQVSAAVSGIDWGSLGRDVINGIAAGIRAAASAIWDALSSVLNEAVSWAKNLLGINSPSKVFAEEVGKWLPEGMAVGIKGNLTPVRSSVDTMAATARAELRKAVSPSVNLNAYNDYGHPGYPMRPEPQQAQKIVIEFTGSLAQLGRVLQPHIQAETVRVGAHMTGGTA